MGQTRTVALGKRDKMSGIAIGMTVIGCLVAVSVIAGVLWLRCSTRRRPSQKADVDLLRKTRSWYAAPAPAQAPAQSQYGQPGIDIELAKPQQTYQAGGNYQQWMEQREARQKEHKEYLRKKRAEMAKMRMDSANGAKRRPSTAD
ncbi:hypothetical protein C8A01DRAFT_19516 [Parachaetomium inaequale]|uniref:Uncharacterized protein n=1 Tax=Parachaetomium inaequale TaxID=2588326 RepID=A0AAN6SNA5_9PEZI|nr:hypothetical protein C8A01DRAFT_19516 [Parachaetomium inaequale]